jgi:hypothetical protein
VSTFNPISGGINLGSVDDNGNVIQTNNYNLQLQAAGFPIDLIKMKNGGYVATWASIATSNGKEFIYFDSAANFAHSKKYGINTWTYIDALMEYAPNKIIIGGTTTIGSEQPSIYYGVNEKGEVTWANTSKSMTNPLSPGQVHCFVSGLDNTVFALGGTGIDGAYGAKLDFNGSGFCNSANQVATIVSSDSVAGSSRTISKFVLTELVEGNIAFTFKDTTFTRSVRCGTLSNTPTEVSKLVNEDFKLYPNPCHEDLKIELPYSADWNVSVFNILGSKMLISKVKNLNQLQLKVSALAPGQYFILVNDGAKQHSLLFIKE